MNRFRCKSAQVIHGTKRSNFWRQGVKRQCQTRPKLDFKTWPRHHSPSLWSSGFPSFKPIRGRGAMQQK